MTLKKQSFESGTNGTTLTTGNLVGTGLTAPNSVTIGASSTLVFDNAHAMHGTFAMKATPATGETTNIIYSGMSSTGLAVSMYIYITAASTVDFFLIRYTVAGTAKAQFRIQGTSKFRVSDTTGVSPGLWTSTNTVPLSTWIRIESYATVNAGAATVQFAYYTGDSTSATESFTTTAANTGSTNFDAVSLGKTDSGTYTTAHWYDSIQVEDAATGLIGPYPAAPTNSVRPSSVVSNPGAWTNQGGAASLQAALADESDTTYIQTVDNPSSAAITFGTASLNAGDVTVKTRNACAISSPTMTRTIELMQGAVVISYRNVTLTTTITNHTWTTSPTETANITDRSNLYIRITDTI